MKWSIYLFQGKACFDAWYLFISSPLGLLISCFVRPEKEVTESYHLIGLTEIRCQQILDLCPKTPQPVFISLQVFCWPTMTVFFTAGDCDCSLPGSFIYSKQTSVTAPGKLKSTVPEHNKNFPWKDSMCIQYRSRTNTKVSRRELISNELWLQGNSNELKHSVAMISISY